MTNLEGSGDSNDISNQTPQEDAQVDAVKAKSKEKRHFSGSSNQSKKKISSAQSVQLSLDKLSGTVETFHKKMDYEIKKCIEILKSLNLKDNPKFFYDCLHLLTKEKDARKVLIYLEEPEFQLGYLQRMVYDST